MLMNAAMFKARVGNDYRSGFPVLATMGWILVFKGRCFLPEKEQTQTDFRIVTGAFRARWDTPTRPCEIFKPK
jgi:hypothetical protein